MFNSNLDFDTVTTVMGSTAAKREASIKARLSDPNFGNSLSDIMRMQVDLALWSATVGACQSCIKELSDAMKSVIQKS